MSEIHDFVPHYSPPAGERLTRVETKVEGMEKDLTVIRSGIHSINGEMQKFVILEERCVGALEGIKTQTLHLPEIAAKLHSWSETQPKVQALLNRDERRKGMWSSWVLAGTAIVGAITLVAGIVTIVAFLIGSKL